MRLTAVLYRVLPAAVGAAAIGCAQLVGIENTIGPGDSIAVTRLSIGSKVVQVPVDPTEISATYLVASRDPSGYDRVSAVPDPSHARLTTQLRTPTPVEFTLKGDATPLPRLFAFPGPPLSVLDFSPTPATSATDIARFGNTLYGVREHPGRKDAPMGATFAVNAALDAAVVAGQSFQVYVVGAWLQRGFSATEAPMVGATQLAPPAFSFTAANSVSGRPQVDQITADDAFLLLRYTGPILTGVAEAMPVTQSDMTGALTTPTFQLPMASVAPGMLSPIFNASVMPSGIAERYKNVRPAVAAPPAVQMTWSLAAAPGYAVASNAGPVLQSGTVAVTDTGVSVSYENPFAARGWNTIFTFTTSVSRVYMAPLGPMGMAIPVTLFAGMNQFLEPPAPPVAAVPLDLPAGLPQVITIGSTVLATDNAFIKQSSQFFNVSFTVDAPSSAADQGPRSYNLQLFDLVFNPTTMVVDRVLVFAAAGKDPAFALPPDLFQVGHSYTLRALSTLGGSPGTEQGELLHPQLPLAQAYLDSGTFTVMP